MQMDYPPNSRVLVHIVRSIPPGLLCRLDNGQRAIIRNREIAWGKPLPLKEYVGQTQEAVVVGFNPAYDELELSLRLAQYDPWRKIDSKYAPGSEVRGEVVGLTEGGAFIELESGIVGFLTVGELAPDPQPRLEDCLWTHDHVQALVTELEPEHRRLRLSLKALLARREARFQRQLWTAQQPDLVSEVTLAERLPTETRLQLLRLASGAEPPASEPQLQVLVIEDDNAYATGLKSLLQRNGCVVTLAEDGLTGLACVHTRPNPFDLILVNWNLPGLKGHEVIRQLEREGCPSRSLLLLEPGPLSTYPEIWVQLRDSGVDILSKSNPEECAVELISILGELRSKEDGSEGSRALYSPRRTASSWEPSLSPTVAEKATPTVRPSQDIETILNRLRVDAKATTVMLLHLEPGLARPVMDGCAGEPFPLEQASHDLIYSPLRDVLQKGQQVCVQVSPTSPSFKRLLDLRPFEGFLGVPLPDMDSTYYALFLLKERGGFEASQRQRSKLAARRISEILHRRRLTRALQTWQAQSLVGQLLNSMVHEVTNKLGGLTYQLEALQDGLAELARWPEKAKDATFLRELQQAAEKITDAHWEAMALKDHYLNVTAKDEPELVDLAGLTENVIHALYAEARQHNIFLLSKVPKDIPPVRARSSQLQQILINLLLNAIQHMARVGRHGNVLIVISSVPGASQPLQIRFIDEGPGIHYQLWERVFDFGFTTKEEGAGLGLTISRQVAENLGGKLEIEESDMLWGTTFLLELPKGV